MSDRRRSDQLDLFVVEPPTQSAGLIAGVEVRLERPCRRCGERVTIIVEGKGPHCAALQCARCDQFRQWLARECHIFLTELVSRCDRPVEPIRIFEQVNRNWAAAAGARPPAGKATAPAKDK